MPPYVQKRHIRGRICLNIRMILKESISSDARGLAPFLGFRRVLPMSSDLFYDVASWRNPSRKSRKSLGRPGRPHIIGYDSRFEIGKARLSGGRWRPPAAQHGHRDHVHTIVRRRFVSAPVIVPNVAKRCVGSVLLALSYIAVRIAFRAVDVGEIHLCRREVECYNPRIPLLLTMVFGSPYALASGR